MGDLTNLTKRTLVEFPQALNLKETESLMRYVAKELPANISYRASYFMNFYHNPIAGERQREVKLEEDLGTISIVGTIRSLTNPMAFDSFEGANPNSQSEKIQALRFFMVPGWDFKDYRPEVVKLWEDVRAIIGNYFLINSVEEKAAI